MSNKYGSLRRSRDREVSSLAERLDCHDCLGDSKSVVRSGRAVRRGGQGMMSWQLVDHEMDKHRKHW